MNFQGFWLLIISVSLNGASAEIISDDDPIPKPHILILGPAWSGKSTLATVLIGEDPSCEQCTFPICHGQTPCTSHTSFSGNHTWLGEETNPLFTVVDTPGFSEDSDGDIDESVEEMVWVLNHDIETADVVLLTIDASFIRFEESFIRMLKTLEITFGRQIWNSTMFEVSKFAFDQMSIDERNHECEDIEYCHNETYYYNELNRIMNHYFDIGMMLPICFIDSWAKKESNIDDETQQKHFLEETDKLWEFSKNSPEFVFQTIDDLKNENAEMKNEIQWLYMVIENNCTEPHDVCNPNPCYNGGTCTVQDWKATCTCPDGYFGDHCELKSDTVRLVGGVDIYEGRVEIYYNGSWANVCDDLWDTNDGTVICRMLGYGPAISAPGKAYYGEGTGKICFDDVKCIGTEADLFHCPYNNLPNCQHGEDAGVICSKSTSMVL